MNNFCCVIFSCLVVFSAAALAASNLNQEVDVTWGDGRGKILNNGELLTLSLDQTSGSGFQSKNEYLFGKIDMQLKLVQGNSAGTVTAYYVSLCNTTNDSFLTSHVIFVVIQNQYFDIMTFRLILRIC